MKEDRGALEGDVEGRAIDLTDADGPAEEPYGDEDGPPRDDFTEVRLRWWVEIIAMVALYLFYSAIRNTFGSASVSPERAFLNARRVVDFERAIGLYFEEDFQDAFLQWPFVLQAFNVFYGTLHFWVTGGALIFLFRKHPAKYSFWRNSLVFTTLFALIGFSWFPLMPPRLLDSCAEFGACASYGFVDTLAQFGGLWSFDSGAMEQISNQYAAMPSLHFAWSFWTFLVLFPRLKHRWSKLLIAAYPWVTLFAIIVTANHYWLDAAGGALALAAGTGLAWVLNQAFGRWRARRARHRTAAVTAA